MCNLANPRHNKAALTRASTGLPPCATASGTLGRLARSDRPRCAFRLGFLGMLAAVFLLSASPSAWAQVTFNGAVSTLSTGSVVLSEPAATAVDSAGNVYISSYGTNQIVKINSQGAASVLAFSGLSAPLSGPWGLALGPSGNLYIADHLNKRIVEVDSAGVASVVNLGSVALAGPAGIAVDAAGDLFIADASGNQIVEAPATGTPSVLSISGLGTALRYPAGVAIDTAGNIDIADYGNNRIVQLAAGGTAGTTVSISGLTAGLAGPQSVAVDELGTVYIADFNNGRIVKVTPGGVGSVLSMGAGTLSGPYGVTVDVSGNVYISDTHNNRIVRIATSAVGFGDVELRTSGTTQTLSFTAGAGTTLGSVVALTLGAKNLDFTVASGTTCTNGTTDATCDVNVQFLPSAPGLRRGALVLYDTASNPLRTVPLYGFADAPLSAAFTRRTARAINTSGGPALSSPYQVTLDGLGNMYVANFAANNVVEITPGGGGAVVVPTGELSLSNVTGVAVDGAGNLFIADHGNGRIVVVPPGGAASVLRIGGLIPELGTPSELNFDAAGNLYTADDFNSRIIRVSSLVVAGSTSSGDGSVIATGIFNLGPGDVTGVAADPRGSLYIADAANNRVIQVSQAGVASILFTAGITPALNDPQGLNVDAMGNLYIADTHNGRIVEVTAAGVASVVNVQGLPFPATNITPIGVAADASGNLFIADTVGDRIVEVPVSDTIAPNTPTIVWAPPFGSTYGNTLSGILNASAESENAPVPGSFTYTATPSGGTASPVTTGTILPIGTYTLTATFTPTDTIDYTSATASVPFTVTKGTATVSVVSSLNPAFLGNPVTFTATVSSPASTPTGTVSFYDGATLLASPETLAQGTATYTTSSLTAGTHSITVIYSGDTNFNGVTSAVLAETVEDFSVNFVSTPGAAAPVVFPGGSATYSLQVGPLSGANFPSPVTFSITGLPANAKATFTPPTLTAGSAGTKVTLVVQLANQILAHNPASRWGRGLTLAMMGGMFLLPFGSNLRRRAGRLRRITGILLLLLALTCVALGLTACGSGAAGYFGQQVQNYTLTVTATSGALSHSATVVLTVQ